MKEVTIEGYSNYTISSTGVVTSYIRKNTKILIANALPNKHTTYRRVILTSDEKVLKSWLIHRLVALAFIPNPENKPHVNHIDNDGSNNNVSNLEWCTHSENMLHCHKQGRCSNIKASNQAKKTVSSRYAVIWRSRLGDRFINWYTAESVNHRGNKPTSAVRYVCSCGIERLALTSWRELKEFDGVCPLCYAESISIVDEDIV